jgi:hypothetical protein
MNGHGVAGGLAPHGMSAMVRFALRRVAGMKRLFQFEVAMDGGDELNRRNEFLPVWKIRI